MGPEDAAMITGATLRHAVLLLTLLPCLRASAETILRGPSSHTVSQHKAFNTHTHNNKDQRPCWIRLHNVALRDGRLLYLVANDSVQLPHNVWPLQDLAYYKDDAFAMHVDVVHDVEVQCDALEQRQACMFSIFNGPHYGHMLANGAGDVFQTLRELGAPTVLPLGGDGSKDSDKQTQTHAPEHSHCEAGSGDTVVLYGSFMGRFVSEKEIEAAVQHEVLPMGIFDYIFDAITGGEPVRSWRHLMHSSLHDGSTRCFRDLTVGLSNAVSHYNDSAGHQLMRDYGAFIKAASMQQLAQHATQLHSTQTEPNASFVPDNDADGQPIHAIEDNHAPSPVALDSSRPASARCLLLGAPSPPHWDTSSVHVLLVSRSERRVLNEKAVVVALRQLLLQHNVKGSVSMANFEGMPLPEQVELVSRTNVLIGVDGTGLLNSYFLPYPCGALISLQAHNHQELWPGKGNNFAMVAQACGGAAYALTNSNPLAVKLDPKVEAAHAPDYWQKTHKKQVARTLLRHQDMVVDERELGEVVLQALHGIVARGCKLQGTDGNGTASLR